MFFNIVKTSDLSASIRALSDLASVNPDLEFDITLSAAQLLQLSGRTVVEGPVDVKIETPAATSPKEEAPVEDAPKKIRRDKDEIAAELTVDQARERRELGLSVDEYLAKDSDENDANPPVEIDDTAPEPTEEEKLEAQPAMSSPPEATTSTAATVDDIREVVTKLLAEGKKDLVVTYTEKLGVPRLSAADPAQYGDIVAYLSGHLDAAEAPLV